MTGRMKLEFAAMLVVFAIIAIGAIHSWSVSEQDREADISFSRE